MITHVMGTSKHYDPNVTFLGVATALAVQVNKDLGTRPGQYLYCDDAMCDVTTYKDGKVQLVGLGWRDLKDCRLVE